MPEIEPSNLSIKIGKGNKLAFFPIDEAINFISSGVDKSLPSEAKKVFPLASGDLQLGVPLSDLIIYNDDVNTFEFVIESIVKICEHSTIQAEQCTWIIHHNGKCSVKRDIAYKLKPMLEAFLDRGISAVIES